MVREAIQKTLDYVDNNVKEDITAEELAKIAGYSVFHFYRLFQSTVEESRHLDYRRDGHRKSWDSGLE